MTAYWPTIFMGICVIGLLWAETTKKRKWQWIFKPLAGVFFMTQAIILGALETRYGTGVLVALVLCWLGDILLIPRENEGLFQCGIIAFALGHLVYALTFQSAEWISLNDYWVLPAVAVVCAGFYLLIRKSLQGEMKAAVIGYMAVISFMVFAAWTYGIVGNARLTPPEGHTNRIFYIPFIAAIMFAVSDMFVARDRFVEHAKWHPFIISPLYFGAQALFAISAGFAA